MRCRDALQASNVGGNALGRAQRQPGIAVTINLPRVLWLPSPKVSPEEKSIS